MKEKTGEVSNRTKTPRESGLNRGKHEPNSKGELDYRDP